MPAFTPPFVAAMIVPTGVGASVGGFAGDAMPHLNLLASVCDVLITHPNVANAAVFQKLPENALYVEGYGLDQFMRGCWALQPVRANWVGVVLDAGIPHDMRVLHLNTINAVRTVYGVDVIGTVTTDAPVAVAIEITEAGCSSGSLRNPAVILEACRRLVDQGATAIALCVLLPDLEEADEAAFEESYRAGGGVDSIGGIEGILSHLVVSELGVPCAHAPVFPWEKAAPERAAVVDPRAAAEYITPTFLPCVLTGLQRAPQMGPVEAAGPYAIGIEQLGALVVPADALGGLPVLCALARGIPVLAVEENRTVLSVDAGCFAALPPERRALIRPVCSYEEAAGILQAMRLGIALPVTPQTGVPAAPESLRR